MIAFFFLLLISAALGTTDAEITLGNVISVNCRMDLIGATSQNLRVSLNISINLHRCF